MRPSTEIQTPVISLAGDGWFLSTAIRSARQLASAHPWKLCRFIVANVDVIAQLAVEHVAVVSVAVSLAILTGVPIGIAITQNQRAADTVLYGASMIMTIPSVALFGLMIPILSLIGQGIGYLPAVIAVLLYSQLPIIRNTYTAITNVTQRYARPRAAWG